MIGSFTLIKNEAPWIAGHLTAWIPVLSEMVFFDGNSTDGTLEIILDFVHNHPQGYKIKLYTDKDPENLKEDYVRLFNECLGSVESDLAFFLHPDMIPARVPKNFDHLKDCVAASVRIRSFAGEPDVSLYEIKGRGEHWKSIYRRHSPNLGAHYHGHYGAANEDVYFSAITGSRHDHYGENFSRYPYEVVDSGIEVLHFSDVRNYARRFDRMVKCLENQGVALGEIPNIARDHPRVSLKDGHGFTFTPAEWPIEFVEARKKYAHLEKSKEPAIV